MIMNFRYKNMGLESKQKLYVFAFGLFIYFITSTLIFNFGKNVAGAEGDSIFYLEMFRFIGENRTSIPLDSYQVASSPIFVHVFGFITSITGNHFNIFVHLFYFTFAVSSIYLVVCMVTKVDFKIRLALIALFTSSGYFVAPSLWPTSDSPAIFFTLLSIHLFLNRSKTWGFSTSIFALVSIRQSLAWLLVLFLIIDFCENIHNKKCLLKKFIFEYGPASFSLLITYIYFDFNITPDIYAESYYGYRIPNFLSILQIGLSMLSVLIPVILIFKIFKFDTKGSILMNYQLSLFFLLTFGILTKAPEHSIPNGLSWLTVLFVKWNFPVILVALLAFIGFSFIILLFSNLNSSLGRFCTVYLMGLSISSLIVPIPFLRYFEINVYILVAIALNGFLGDKKFNNSFPSVLLGVFVVSLNFVKILM